MTLLDVLCPIAACKDGGGRRREGGKFDSGSTSFHLGTYILTAYDRNSSGLTSVTDSKAANSKTRQRRCFFSRSSVREGLQPPKRQGPPGRDQGTPQVRAIKGTSGHPMAPRRDTQVDRCRWCSGWFIFQSRTNQNPPNSEPQMHRNLQKMPPSGLNSKPEWSCCLPL